MEVRRTGYKFQEFDRVLQIEWTLGNTCNYNCSYCLPVLHDNSFPWINLDESIRFIDRLHEHYDAIGIENYIWKFGGGEPTLYKHFSDLCEYINRKSNNYIIPITNGSRKLNWWKANYKNFFAVHFSIHPEFCNTKHIVEVCDYLIDVGVDSICHVMIKPDEFDKCKQIIEDLKASRNKNWGIQAKPLHHIWETDTADERDLYPYDIDQKNIFNKVIRPQDRVSERVDNKLNRDMYMYVAETNGKGENLLSRRDFDPYWAVTHGITDWRHYQCRAGINRIYINYDKRVYLGAGCRVELGNFTGLKYDDPELQFPVNSTFCTQERCVCIADVQVPKGR